MEISNTWAPVPNREGYLSKTVKRGAHTVTILRPELSDTERAKRMASIKREAARLVLETEKAKHRKLHNIKRKATS